MEFKVFVKRKDNDKINELLLKLRVRCDFQITEQNDKNKPSSKLKIQMTNIWFYKRIKKLETIITEKK